MLKKIIAIICSVSMAMAVMSCGVDNSSGTSAPVKDVQTGTPAEQTTTPQNNEHETETDADTTSISLPETETEADAGVENQQ